MENTHTTQTKSNAALREEAVLAFWKEQDIFNKTLTKGSYPNGDFVFYEGPPTANAKPALHHLEARAFKDVMPRYKTMQGYRVARRAGWDTHGLPVELQIEKKIGSTSKKDIETYGIAKFNRECRDSVFTYIKDWEVFTNRIGYWVDKENAYYTFDANYMESLWSIFGKVYERGLVYKDYRVVPWCPRCGTALASHELAQEYHDDKDLTVTAKFKLVDQENTFILAWTTTPWTLPGNVALAVGDDIDYVTIKQNNELLILAKTRLEIVTGEYDIVKEMKGSDLVGLSYEPLYSYLRDALVAKGESKEAVEKSFKVYAADFVTTTDGTGIVHTAVMYGQEDFELGTKIGLPKMHTVDDTGHFLPNMDFLSGRFVKDEDVAVDIIKDLANRPTGSLLFKKEKYEHSYPHCWRCKTALIYYARDSWYIAMSKLRQELIDANETINWEPDHIKEGRFGEWIREVKDWAISRERYWGTPLPIWVSRDDERIVVDSVATLKTYAKKSGNTYYVMRHGQTEHNVRQEWNCDPRTPDPMTEMGMQQSKDVATSFDGDIDIVITSPYTRTVETARLFSEAKSLAAEIVQDDRLREWEVGAQFNNKPFTEYFDVRNSSADRYTFKTDDGESYLDILARAGAFIYDIEQKYQGKKILIVTHGAVARALELVARGYSVSSLFETTRDYTNFANAEIRQIDFAPLPHNDTYEIDLHRPYIDDVVLVKDGIEYRRTKEVMDVWFDSGSMPFAQDHYPFEHKDDLSYPADFISEAIDQTRGWFYTLLAVGVLMERGAPYKNVICLGHLLDKDGKKMSKSIGNIVEPYEQMDKFGVDAVRFWMYSVNQPGESKNYDEKSIVEINNKVFNLLGNVYSFYELYRDKELENKEYVQSEHVLDAWIIARMNQLVATMTEKLDAYDLFTPTRALREFLDDLSTWYLRRSRDRLKDGDISAKSTLYIVLKTTAQLLAPFAPFTAEDLWQKLKIESDEESVHLSVWSKTGSVDEEIIKNMEVVRILCTEGNALRKKEAIPVRQPLAKLIAKEWNLSHEYEVLVMEELNVKAVEKGAETKLDTAITPELKLEGDYRELVRVVQDLRKEKGLQPQDVISLTLPTKYQEIVDTFGEELKKTVGASEIAVSGEEIIIG